MTTFIIIILIAVAIVFFLSRKKTETPINKTTVDTFLSGLPNMSNEDLDKMFMDLTTTLFLRDLTAEKFNACYATNICKNVDYGCHSYSDVVMLHEATHKEIKRRKL
ncbi:MAG: hypothetical protein IJ435_01310 [Clostridia bacterium]|nr:hypothetical protein [Clostridia bacterium]